MVLRSLREKAATENRAHRNKRQSTIFAHQKSQSIRELELLNLSRLSDPWTLRFSSQRTLRIQRHKGQVGVRQVICGDPLNVIERHLLDSIEIIPAEIQISREKPIRANIRSLAAHCR